MISDSFLYSGDDAMMISEPQHCHVAVREHSGISSMGEAGLSVGTSMYVHLRKSLFNRMATIQVPATSL